MDEHPTMLLWPDGAPMARGEATEDKPDMTLYLPDGYDKSSRRGLVVILPGGGYHAKAYHEGEPIAQWLSAAGIPAAVVQYRVSPYRYPVPAEDARRAIRLARFHADDWGIDPTRIAILGFSAGGHCAGTAATIHEAVFINPDDPVDNFSSRPDAFISCYSVLTFSEKRHDGSLRNLLEDADGQVDPAMQEYLSLENRVTDNTPTTFLWATFTDGAVPIESTLYFANALRAHNVPFELHIFPEGPHGLGLAASRPQVAQWTTLCVNWLKSLGYAD